jgi:hypothetical protein
MSDSLETIAQILRAELAPVRDELAAISRRLDALEPAVAGIPIIHRAIENLREEQRTIRDDLDKLIALSRRLLEDGIVTGGALVRIERRLEKLETARNGA